jgi:DNA-binding PadR family transcriptional regulator
MRKNLSQYAVLGLLAGGPRTGYEVAKEVASVLSHFWRESDGQIYPVLKRLDEVGLAQREEETIAQGRRRVSYRITDDGRAALADWLALPVEPQPPRQEVLLKLFFGRHARPGDLKRILSAYSENAKRVLAHLELQNALVRSEHASDPDAIYWQLSIDFGRASLRAITEWSQAAISTLEALEADQK